MDYSAASLWDLAFELDPSDQVKCKEIDDYLHLAIKNIDNLKEIFFHLCYGEMHLLLPKTLNKVNELLRLELEKENVEWSLFSNFNIWLNDATKQKLTTIWLNSEDTSFNTDWLTDTIFENENISIEVLKKLINLYKSSKTQTNINMVEKAFMFLNKNDLKDGCVAMAKGTPAVSVFLLKRDDVEEKYTITGLKSLSKLSKQRNLDIKIDFNTLKHLGPKGRLDAMKQLMGMFDKYYKFKKEKQNNNSYYYGWKEKQLKKNSKEYSLPFKEVPNKEDIETFLFPCSIKYNEEVVNMIERFKELINQEGEN